jgi:hypothetical protein
MSSVAGSTCNASVCCPSSTRISSGQVEQLAAGPYTGLVSGSPRRINDGSAGPAV